MAKEENGHQATRPIVSSRWAAEQFRVLRHIGLLISPATASITTATPKNNQIKYCIRKKKVNIKRRMEMLGLPFYAGLYRPLRAWHHPHIYIYIFFFFVSKIKGGLRFWSRPIPITLATLLFCFFLLSSKFSPFIIFLTKRKRNFHNTGGNSQFSHVYPSLFLFIL